MSRLPVRMEGLQVTGLTKCYATTPVFEDVQIELPRGRTLAVLGASGCGKTTLLRVIAGLEAADAGWVRLGGRDIGRLSPQQRQALYLYQEALLFPHLDVLENVAFGLRLRRCPQRELRAICLELLAQLELEGLERRMPEQLSGGQRQRVAFGRALAVRPQLLLLDEPFGSLDAQTRSSMQMLFQRVAAQYGMTTVFVTHDVQEALRVGNCFAMLAQGRLNSFASRADFCADPASGVAHELAFWSQIAGSAQVQKDPAIGSKSLLDERKSKAC